MSSSSNLRASLAPIVVASSDDGGNNKLQPGGGAGVHRAQQQHGGRPPVPGGGSALVQETTSPQFTTPVMPTPLIGAWSDYWGDPNPSALAPFAGNGAVGAHKSPGVGMHPQQHRSPATVGGSAGAAPTGGQGMGDATESGGDDISSLLQAAADEIIQSVEQERARSQASHQTGGGPSEPTSPQTGGTPLTGGGNQQQRIKMSFFPSSNDSAHISSAFDDGAEVDNTHLNAIARHGHHHHPTATSTQPQPQQPQQRGSAAASSSFPYGDGGAVMASTAAAASYVPSYDTPSPQQQQQLPTASMTLICNHTSSFTPPPPPSGDLLHYFTLESRGEDTLTGPYSAEAEGHLRAALHRWTTHVEAWLQNHPAERPTVACPLFEQFGAVSVWATKVQAWYRANFLPRAQRQSAKRTLAVTSRAAGGSGEHRGGGGRGHQHLGDGGGEDGGGRRGPPATGDRNGNRPAPYHNTQHRGGGGGRGGASQGGGFFVSGGNDPSAAFRGAAGAYSMMGLTATGFEASNAALGSSSHPAPPAFYLHQHQQHATGGMTPSHAFAFTAPMMTSMAQGPPRVGYQMFNVFPEQQHLGAVGVSPSMMHATMSQPHGGDASGGGPGAGGGYRRFGQQPSRHNGSERGGGGGGAAFLPSAPR